MGSTPADPGGRDGADREGNPGSPPGGQGRSEVAQQAQQEVGVRVRRGTGLAPAGAVSTACIASRGTDGDQPVKRVTLVGVARDRDPVGAGPLRQAGDGVAVDVDQAPGLSDATALGEVLEDGAGLLLREVGVEQRRALTLGEAVSAGLAVEQADVVVHAVAGADGEVPGVALAVGGAIGILATEARGRP